MNVTAYAIEENSITIVKKIAMMRWRSMGELHHPGMSNFRLGAVYHSSRTNLSMRSIASRRSAIA